VLVQRYFFSISATFPLSAGAMPFVSFAVMLEILLHIMSQQEPHFIEKVARE
jgi:hypothetical protein